LSEGFVEAPYQFDLLHKKLSSNLPGLFSACIEEVDHAICAEIEICGMEKNQGWIDLNMHKFFSGVIARLSNRAFIPDFSGDASLLESMKSFADLLPKGAAVASILPEWLGRLRERVYFQSLYPHRLTKSLATFLS
jgi:hypothetical protein